LQIKVKKFSHEIILAKMKNKIFLTNLTQKPRSTLNPEINYNNFGIIDIPRSLGNAKMLTAQKL
jgi:hypothetical protein